MYFHYDIFQILHISSNKCIMRPTAKGTYSQPSGYAVLETCLPRPILSQMFVMTKDGIIMTDESVCLDAPDHDTQHKTPKVKIMACSGHDRQKWRYDEQVCFEFLPVFVYKLWINSESLFCPF